MQYCHVKWTNTCLDLASGEHSEQLCSHHGGKNDGLTHYLVLWYIEEDLIGFDTTWKLSTVLYVCADGGWCTAIL